MNEGEEKVFWLVSAFSPCDEVGWQCGAVYCGAVYWGVKVTCVWENNEHVTLLGDFNEKIGIEVVRVAQDLKELLISPMWIYSIRTFFVIHRVAMNNSLNTSLDTKGYIISSRSVMIVVAHNVYFLLSNETNL